LLPPAITAWSDLVFHRNWKKSVRLPAPTLDEPISTIAERQDWKASACNRARCAVNATVLVVVGIQKITALINPIIRRHVSAVEYSAGRNWHPYEEKKSAKLDEREIHCFL
jgi:hypothetical protein